MVEAQCGGGNAICDDGGSTSLRDFVDSHVDRIERNASEGRFIAATSFTEGESGGGGGGGGTGGRRRPIAEQPLLGSFAPAFEDGLDKGGMQFFLGQAGTGSR